MMLNDSPKLSRRQFLLQHLALWGGILSSVVLIFEEFQFPKLQRSQTQFILGFPQQFMVGSVTYFTLSQAWLIREKRGFYALRAVCTHLGCLPQWQSKGFLCPCHQSRFTKEGKVVKGPARRALERYHLHWNKQGEILLDTARVYRFEMGEWDDPRAFLAYI